MLNLLANCQRAPTADVSTGLKTPIQPTTCARPQSALLSCSLNRGRKRPVSARFRICALAVNIGLLRMLEDLRWGRNDTETRRSGLGGRSMSKPGARAAFRGAN